MPSHWLPRAVLFDFDGTLADSFQAITASVNHVRDRHGMAPLTQDEVSRHVGWGPGHLLTQTVGCGDLAENQRAYAEHHPTVLASGTRLLPGAAELLRAVHEAGLPIALTSNKPRIYSAELLALLGVASYFQAVFGPGDVPRPKPDPDMLLAALGRFGVAPADAVYVGDMTIDIATGRAAGVVVWVVATGAQPVETLTAAGPDALFPDLDAVRRRLAEVGAVR